MEQGFERSDARINEKDAFYRALAQEVCGPLGAAMNAVEVIRMLLEKHPVLKKEQLEGQVETLWENMLVANRMAQNMNDISLDGAPEENKDDIELLALVKIVVQTMKPYAAREGVELVLEGGEDAWVAGDAALAERVIISLLSGMVLAAVGAGRITLSVTAGEEYGTVSVADDRLYKGVGRAFLGEEAEKRADAAGQLSLYLAQSFCRRMGWQMECCPKGDSAGFALAAPVCGKEKVLVLRSGDDTFEEEYRKKRVRREIELLLGKL